VATSWRIALLRGRDDRAAHDVAVAVRELGQAVNEHVDVVLPVVVEAGERVVHDRQRACGPGSARQPGDVGDLQDRIRRALEQHQPGGLRRQHALDAGVVLDREQRVRDAVPAQHAPQEVPAGAIGLGEAQHVIAGLEQREQRSRDGGDAGADAQAVFAPLQFRQQLFQLARGGVGGARVEIAFALAAEQALALGDGVERELDALVDGRHQWPVVRGQRRGGRVIDAGAVLHR
jgi:hypothetical protein